MDRLLSESDTNKIIGPHHYGILSKRKMKRNHDCAQCCEKDCEVYVVHIVVLWKRFQDLYVVCCQKCINRLEECTIGEIL